MSVAADDLTQVIPSQTKSNLSSRRNDNDAVTSSKATITCD